jgi:putative phage-type endonuclease
VTATPLPDLQPGSEAWQRRMTASKVAAVLGLSPWESRFSLWHRMAGLVDPQEPTDATRRGHYLEDAVASWFADQHPEYLIDKGRAWAHEERDWQAASPDRLLRDRTRFIQADPGPHAVLEVKTTADADEWGPSGTDQIPPHVRVQVVWQLDTLGLPVGHVAALLPRLEFREYRIDYNPDEAAYIRAEARAFLDSLPGGPAEQRPDLDAHGATYQAVRVLHPDIDGTDSPVPHWLARSYCAAVTDLRKATKAHDYWRTVLADHMRTAKRARYDGRTIADRRAKNGAPPYVQAATRLPAIPDEEPTP